MGFPCVFLSLFVLWEQTLLGFRIWELGVGIQVCKAADPSVRCSLHSRVAFLGSGISCLWSSQLTISCCGFQPILRQGCRMMGFPCLIFWGWIPLLIPRLASTSSFMTILHHKEQQHISTIICFQDNFTIVKCLWFCVCFLLTAIHGFEDARQANSSLLKGFFSNE